MSEDDGSQGIVGRGGSRWLGRAHGGKEGKNAMDN